MSEALGKLVGTSALFLIFCAFVFPVGLYPYQDMFRDVLVFASGVLLLSYVLWSRRFVLSFPLFVIFIPAFILGLVLNYQLTPATIDISHNLHLLSFLLCGFVAICVASYAESFSKERVIRWLAFFVLAVFVVSAFFGLIRFYGVLGHFVSLVTEDGNRLMGPMGQPNLMAIAAALGLCSILYLRSEGRFRSSWVIVPLLVLTFYVGSLTGSRSWYIAAIIALWPLIVEIKGSLTEKRFSDARYVAKERVSPSTVVLLFLAVSFLAPKVDGLIASPLSEAGFIERVSASEMYENKKFLGSSGRLNEWRKVVSGLPETSSLWFGYGAGRYGTYSNEVALNEDRTNTGKIWNNAHNIILNFLVEWGVFGLLILLTFAAYVLWRVKVSERSPSNVYLVTTIFIFIFHNLVEFSLWYMPFLAVCVAAFTLLDKRCSFSFSSQWIRRVIAGATLVVFLPLGAYVVNDMAVVTRIMYKENPDFMDQVALRDASRSSIVGDGALSVLILRFSPPAFGVGSELAMVESFADWRPEPLFVLRRATLLAASGETQASCEVIKRAIRLYPDTVNTIQEELGYLSRKTDVKLDEYLPCIAEGISYWVD